MVSIIGLGFVGSAMLKSFQLKNVKNIKTYDKYKDSDSFNECLSNNIIFLALPTLFDEKIKRYNKEAIHEICSKLNSSHYNGVVVIKSTIEPESTNELAKIYNNLNFVHNPEFLTARTAFKDFHNQKHVVLGKQQNCLEEVYNYLIEFYKENYPKAKITLCNSIESESMKCFVNSFYSVKIQFFNELYLLCKKNGSNFEKIKEMMLYNGWINPMHTQVPGHDGKLSYGGACFPKDTNALNMYMKSKDSPNEVLQATINERNKIRN